MYVCLGVAISRSRETSIKGDGLAAGGGDLAVEGGDLAAGVATSRSREAASRPGVATREFYMVFCAACAPPSTLTELE